MEHGPPCKIDTAQQKTGDQRYDARDRKPQRIFADRRRHIACEAEDERETGPCSQFIAAGSLIRRPLLLAVVRRAANRFRSGILFRGHVDSPQLRTPSKAKLKNCDRLSIQDRKSQRLHSSHKSASSMT